MGKDYYDILGVDKNASKEEIKKAYKKLAKEHHPDLNKGDPDSAEKFKELNEAASVLADEKKRKQYDQFGSDSFKNGNAGGFSDFNFSGFGGGNQFDFGDIFDTVFGGGFSGFGGRKRGRGSDLRFDLEVTLEEAAEGVKKTIVIPRLEKCSRCGGTGAESDSDIKRCSTCNGSGHIQETRRTPFGLFRTNAPCSTCHGTGEIIKNICPICDGEGRTEKSRKLTVDIPAGVDDDNRLRMSGEGEAGERGQDPGDLYILIHVKPHEDFIRKGNDIFLDVNISFVQATLGDEIEVPTLKGKAKLKIPSGTQPHTVFRMRSKGIPNLNGYGRGDENVRVLVDIPTKVSRNQKELLKEFEKAKGKSFFGL